MSLIKKSTIMRLTLVLVLTTAFAQADRINIYAMESIYEKEIDTQTETETEIETETESESCSETESETESSKGNSNKDNKKDTVETVLDVKLTLSTYIYRGDKISLKIKNLPLASKINVSSSNRSVAQINKKGIIKANHCGKAKLTMNINTRNGNKILVLNTKVIKCSYRSKKKLTLYKKEKAKIIASTNVKGAKTSITSSNKRIAPIKNTTITGKANGKTTISATSKLNNKSLSLSLELNVSKKPNLKITEKMKDNFFKGSVMAGHSVGVGFKAFCAGKYNGFLGNAMHISVGCYGVYNDFAPVTATSLHPTINGKKARLKDHIKALKVKKVFINYGLNDIGCFGPERFINRYKDLINELIKENKKTTVYIVSPTPMFKDRGLLSNKSMRIINKALKKYAKKTKRVEFIDVYTPMLDDSGKLRASYCSDHYCHITWAGYEVYANTLKEFAATKLQGEIDKKDKSFTRKETKKYKK